MKLQIKRLPHGAAFKLPYYATEDSAGLDLIAAIEAPIILKPLARQLIPTGLALALPKGYEGQIRPRSGLAFKHGVTVLNSPGTIDSDYRGEVKILLINLGSEDFAITPAMRLAQLVVSKYQKVSFTEVSELSETVREEGGFGSTGTN